METESSRTAPPRPPLGLDARTQGLAADPAARQLFFALLNVEEAPSAARAAERFAARHLELADREVTRGDPWSEAAGTAPGSPAAIETAARALFEHWMESVPIPAAPPATEEVHTLCIVQHLPAVAIESWLLQQLVNVASTQSPLYPALYALYSGLSTLAAPHPLHAWARARGHELPGVTNRGYAEHTAFLDGAFERPALDLALACQPRSLLPELLAVLLVRELGLSPYRAWTAALWPPGAPPLCAPRASSLAGRALLACLQQVDAPAVLWPRALRALRAEWRAEAALIAAMATEIGRRTRSDPRTEAMEVLRSKLPYARGHHRELQIGGRPLETWFAAPDPDLEGLLEALAGSPFINTAEPEQSRFLTELLAVGGPMFRVFSEREIGVLLDWIRSPGRAKPTISSAPRSPALAPRPKGNGALPPAAQVDGPPPGDPRRLYHELVNVDLYPESLVPARALVASSMARTGRALRGRRLPAHLAPFPYTTAVFNERIETTYSEAVAAYRPFSPPPRLHKEELLWLLIRLAPLILVDGCWLQGAGRLRDTHPAVARRLSETYADEIGRGEPDRHHANIYRKLLRSQGIDLPEVTAPEFIQRPEFPRSVFDLPCLFLAISQYPRLYLPELLGLNLAIELSGLGAFYMQLVDAMRYFGLDPAFVTTHIASDNLASGHTALAREAVTLYLDEIRERQGGEAQQFYWRRVWTGFASLTVVPRRAWRALALRILARFGPVRLRRMLYRSLPFRRHSVPP